MLKLSTSLWILGSLLCASTCLSPQLKSQDSNSATAFGTVLDVYKGIVPGARVELDGPNPTDHESTVALDTGLFKFENLKPGIKYHVVISRAGFAPWTSSEFTLDRGQVFEITGIVLRIATVETSVTAMSVEQLATQQIALEERQRAFGFIPNFYVNYDNNTMPLTAKLKFKLAFRALLDPVTLGGFVLNASIYQAARHPDYVSGAKGFGQRLGSTFAGGYTNVLIGDALLPSLLHQDPRYFYKGSGTVRSRLLHALAYPIITRGDDGRPSINYSAIGGDLASGAIANAYYPTQDRGPGLVLRSALIGAAGRSINGVIQEFLLKKVTSRYNKRH
jgi:hypothetical protein